MHIDRIKQTKIQEAKDLRDLKDISGVLVVDKWFHSDEKSQIRYMALVVLGANIPAGLQWKTMDGTKVNMTQQLINQVYIEAIQKAMERFDVCEAHIDAINLSEDPTNYDVTIGWPASFNA